MKIYYYFHKQQHYGSVSKQKVENMMKSLKLFDTVMQVCDISEFDGHLMSKEWL